MSERVSQGHTSHQSPQSSKAASSTYYDLEHEHLTKIPFPPLPSIPSASLTFPSFRDVPVHSILTIDDPASSKITWPLMPSTPPPSPPTISLSCLGSSEGHHPTTGDDPSQDSGHPNSPYVPWQTPARRQITRPLTASNFSLPSGCYSRPLSRSGARAPEPDDVSNLDGSRQPIARMSGRWRTIQQHVNVNVRRVTKSSFDHLSRPFKIVMLRLQFTCGTPANLMQQASQEHVLNLASRPAPPSSRARRRSEDTFGSRDLDAWLATRRRLSMEGDDTPGGMLSIGGPSWANRVSMAAVNPVCGVPGCNLPHPAGDSAVSHAGDLDAESSWFSRRFDTPSRRLLSHSSMSTPSTPMRPLVPFTIQSRRSLSVDDVTVTEKDILQRELLRSRKREMSMPGGWVFGV